MSDRKYMSIDAFRALLQQAKEVPGVELKTDDVCLIRPAQATEVRAIGDGESRLIEFVISDSSVDREQDTIAVEGWDFKDFRNNPVVLWAHDQWAPPIARAQSVYTDGDKVHSVAQFMPPDMDGGFSAMIYRMYKEKFLHAVSVGFQPREYSIAEDRKFGLNFQKQSLLEYSAVPVPANPNALAVARSKGINLAPLKAWAERALDETHPSDAQRQRLEVLRMAAVPMRAVLIDLGGDMADNRDEKATPPAQTTIKKVVTERWECKDGHAHDSEAQAQECERFDKMVDGVATAVEGMVTLVKAGRVLSAANEERIRNAVASLGEVLAQLEQVEEEVEGTDNAEEEAGEKSGGVLLVEERSPEDGVLFEVDPELVTAAIRDAVGEELRKVTGRLD